MNALFQLAHSSGQTCARPSITTLHPRQVPWLIRSLFNYTHWQTTVTHICMSDMHTYLYDKQTQESTVLGMQSYIVVLCCIWHWKISHYSIAIMNHMKLCNLYFLFSFRDLTPWMELFSELWCFQSPGKI